MRRLNRPAPYCAAEHLRGWPGRSPQDACQFHGCSRRAGGLPGMGTCPSVPGAGSSSADL